MENIKKNNTAEIFATPLLNGTPSVDLYNSVRNKYITHHFTQNEAIVANKDDSTKISHDTVYNKYVEEFLKNNTKNSYPHSSLPTRIDLYKYYSHSIEYNTDWLKYTVGNIIKHCYKIMLKNNDLPREIQIQFLIKELAYIKLLGIPLTPESINIILSEVLYDKKIHDQESSVDNTDSNTLTNDEQEKINELFDDFTEKSNRIILNEFDTYIQATILENRRLDQEVILDKKYPPIASEAKTKKSTSILRKLFHYFDNFPSDPGRSLENKKGMKDRYE